MVQAFYNAQKQNSPQAQVQSIFIFDPDILDLLKDKSDHRVTLIYDWLNELREEYRKLGSDLWVFYGKPLEIFKQLSQQLSVSSVYTNHDYEPFARRRDDEVREFLIGQKIHFQSFKDQVIFEKNEVLSGDQRPYTVFTPYKKKWLSQFKTPDLILDMEPFKKFLRSQNQKLPGVKVDVDLATMGFQRNTNIPPPQFNLDPFLLKNYERDRDFPALAGTSMLGTALRFGKVSVREMATLAYKTSEVWLSELIWREFFMQILYHFPQVQKKSFRDKYENVEWRKSKEDFEKWKTGMTGYPIVDAGMRELNATGYMHNRVRMIVGSFLTKHLLIHWYHGERYFAEKLFDYDLSANNGNWQWVAGTGCDAAPYFRIFNPTSQAEKFDENEKYIRRWVPEYMNPAKYPRPMVDHAFARLRALEAFKKAVGKEEDKL